MQQVNDYMDDLFKEAADHYPLNTKSSDWANFSKKLDRQPDANAGGLPKNAFYEQSKKWAMAVAFVFLPLAITVVRLNWHNRPPAVAISDNGNISAVGQHAEKQSINTQPKATTATNHFYIIPTSLNVPVISDKTSDVASTRGSSFNDGKALADLKTETKSIEDILHSNAGDLVLNNEITENKTPPVLSQQQTGNSNSQGKKPRFYLGAVLAPEYTRVKQQEFTRPGINFGIITGFQVNDRLSVELSVLLARKYYYTDGKYLKHDLRRDGADILSIEAYNSITELPLVVKYNFSQKSKSNFFATAGAVSYVMHKELYNYSYDANGQEKQGVKSVNKSSNYYFSNIQLSAGYERQFSKNATLRVEPYYRIPVSGIGISDLPVTSIGLNIALTTTLK